jgi:predicted amidophosphoribosyltransferase
MKIGDRHTCEVCGTQVSADRDVCPVCVLRATITEEVSSEESASEPPVVGSISEPVERRFENYKLILDADGRPIELGRGAMGVTYKAFDVDLRCPVT